MNQPIARASDPQTSHDAAAQITASGRRETLRQQCLAAVFTHPGRTAGEIGDLTGLGYDKVWRRASELKRDGLIFEGEPRVWHGRAQVTLWPTLSAPDASTVRYEPHVCRTERPRGVVVREGSDGGWWIVRGRTRIPATHCPYCGVRLGLPKGGEHAAQPHLGL